MKRINTTAIIIKRINFSEADRILTVITPDQGRLSLLAKGVRKSKSKLAGGLELFSISDITYIDGRSELKTIISTKLNNHFSNIVKDVAKTMRAYDYLKAFDLLTQHGVEDGVFDILKNTFDYIDEENSHLFVSDLWIVAKILSIEGRGINLEKPLNKSEFSEDVKYDFSYEDMAFNENSNGAYDSKHIKLLRYVSVSEKPIDIHKINDFKKYCSDLNQVSNNLLKMHKT